MVEPEEKSQNTTRISKLAIAVLVLGIFGPLFGLIVIVIIFIAHFILSYTYSPFFLFPIDALAIGYLVSWLPAYLMGKNALYKIDESKGTLRGTGFSKVGITSAKVWAIILPVLLFIAIQFAARAHQASPRMICGSNLAGLGKGLLLYAEEHGSYTESDKWCDILLGSEYVTEKMFKCPDNKKVRCGYSMNPNCEPNSPPDAVLLFESKGGWNSYGGSELFTAENHKKEGGNVLFNDCHVMFIKTDPNGLLLKALNWGEKK